MANEKEKLRTQKEINKEIEGRKQNLKDIEALERKGYNSAVQSRDVEKQKVDLKKESYKLEADTVSLSKQIERLKKSGLQSVNKELGLEQQIVGLEKIQAIGDVKKNKAASNYISLLEDINEGKDFESILNKAAIDDYGEMEEAVSDLIDTLRESPEILAKLGREKKFADMIDQVKDTLGLIDLKKTFTFAGILALAKEFAGSMLEVRQSLGTSVVESARVAGNLKIAGLAAKAVGGSSEQAEAAVMSLVDEFGSVSVITAGVSKQLGLITGQFGLSGDNAGKLVKQLQAINGASIETNLNLISSVGELARAEGVAPAKVLNDIAGDTETFAKFAKDGGKNIAAAAIQAAKLGLNMATVAGIAENLLDFESSIEKQMEASVLLGRQLNLDKARELSLMGDLEGLQKEVLKQIGSEAEFNAMNVVQRKALADAIGVSVADLGKMVAGEQTSAQAAADRVKQEQKSLQLQKASAVASLMTAAAQIGGGFGKFGPAGFALAIPAIMGLYALVKKAPKAQTGGVVRETGMAVVHKGETIAGTQFGGRESNNLLKELIAQNATLMGKLTNKVGEMALGS